MLDTVWTRRHAHLGVLVRYADDFVVMCDTKAACEQAEQRVRRIFARLGLELHPEKTRLVNFSRGREGFDFLGCHLRKRMSGPIWERARATRLLPASRSLTARDGAGARSCARADSSRRCHADLRIVIAELNPVLRGWGTYFRTGNAANHLLTSTSMSNADCGLLLKRAGSRLTAGRAEPWKRPFFEHLGLIRLRGTIQYPGSHATT